MLQAYSKVDSSQIKGENYDQFAIFLELMKSIDHGEDLVMRILGRMPRISGKLLVFHSSIYSAM